MPENEKKYCKDCGSELFGEFCSHCGQRDVELRVPFKELVGEFVEEFFSFDARLLKSIKPFLLRPGLLTLEYVSGKRTRFISPFKLYFFMSFLFFFFLATTRDDSTTVFKKELKNSNSILENDTTNENIELEKYKGIHFTTRSVVGKNDSLEIEKKFGHRFTQGLLKVKKDPQLFLDKIREHIPQIIFILLPLFALLLKLVYVRSKLFYIQHIVFTFYFHSYIFLIFLMISILDFTNIPFVSEYADLLILAIPLNLYKGMRSVYKQPRGKTFLKFFILSICYGSILIVVLIASLLILIAFF